MADKNIDNSLKSVESFGIEKEIFKKPKNSLPYWGLLGLVLARQVLYHFSHTPSLFCFSYFSNRVSP
jgi:hypothetical protein